MDRRSFFAAAGASAALPLLPGVGVAGGSLIDGLGPSTQFIYVTGGEVKRFVCVSRPIPEELLEHRDGIDLRLSRIRVRFRDKWVYLEGCGEQG